MIPSLQLASGTSLTTTTTLTLVPGLSIFLAAGGVFRFEGHLLYRANAASACNLVVGVGGSCTASFVEYHTAIQTATDGTSNHKAIAALVSTTIAGATAPSVTGTNFAAKIQQGLIVVATAGTLEVQARHTSTSSCAVQTGGRLLVEQLA